MYQKAQAEIAVHILNFWLFCVQQLTIVQPEEICDQGNCVKMETVKWEAFVY